MIWQFLSWYLVATLCGLAALPLGMRLFARVPGNGIPLARPLGILLTGYLFWLGFSLGLLRNEAGGAWLALIAVAAISLALGRSALRGWRSIEWRGILVAEVIFLLTFAVWATVRSYNAAANHTEQPMDLMFMSSLWASPRFPPQDAWLSGYPISYYYGGYWLLVTLGRLAGTPPEIAYNLGQACWYGLLLSAVYGVVYALLRLPRMNSVAGLRYWGAAAGGLLASLWVGVTGNVQSILEWLHAQGVSVDGLARWAQVNGFPDGAAVTHKWYIAMGEWWWWRTSRVLADASLRGDHQEVIAEIPSFSYLLGDNHPHVLAMPFVVLLVGLALAWFMHDEPTAPKEGWRALIPVDKALLVVTTLVAGSLLWLNTWDFPPYLLLLALVALTVPGDRRFLRAAALAAIIVCGSILLFLPFFLTAQSQASGLNANLFNPTRLPQFLWVFLAGLLGAGALYVLAWRERPARWRTWIITCAVLIGGAVLTLLAAYGLVTTVNAQEFAASNPLPDGATGYAALFMQRWLAAPWTLLLTGILAALAAALWLRRIGDSGRSPITFALLLAGVGLLLTMTPEVVFLRDNFGWRMNTIFKFYYQAWLLLGLAAAVGVSLALSGTPRRQPIAIALAVPALLLVLLGLTFPAAGAWSRTNGFAGAPTFDAAAYLESAGPAELAAARWLRDNAPADAVVLQAKGRSYHSEDNRLATLSGRPTLMGWDGHESQWRGDAFAAMAEGRDSVLDQVYRLGDPQTVPQLLDHWDIDFVVVGPAERTAYGLTPLDEQRLLAVMDIAFEQDDVRVLTRRTSLTGLRQ